MKNFKFIWCFLLVNCWSILGYASGTDPNSITDPNAVAEPNSITSFSDWISLMNNPSAWDKSYILTCDIDLSGIIVTPIGTLSSPFIGSIDGNGHVIRNAELNCSGKNYVGLIGYLGNGGSISQLGVESISLTGSKFVGGLAGYTYHGTIESCYCTGIANGISEVGGLVGRNSGQINSCYSNCSVTGNTLVGGLAGTNYGLAAFVNACYSSGTVVGTDSDGYAGGIIGKNSGFVYSCFWDMDTSGLNRSSGGKGLTTNKMKDMTVYQNAGWFDCDWIINHEYDYPRLAWENSIGQPIPAVSNIPLSGSGTETDPYLISNAEELALLSKYVSVLDKHIILTSDIDASNIDVYPIGCLGPFSGVFNGAGHIVKNLTITNTSNDYVGLFGVVHNASINMLGVHNVNISGNDYVGGLVGCNLGGQIDSCYVTGQVSGKSYVGGLTGYSSIKISQY